MLFSSLVTWELPGPGEPDASLATRPDASLATRPRRARCQSGSQAQESQMPVWLPGPGEPDASLATRPRRARCQPGSQAQESQMLVWLPEAGLPSDCTHLVLLDIDELRDTLTNREPSSHTKRGAHETQSVELCLVCTKPARSPQKPTTFGSSIILL